MLQDFMCFNPDCAAVEVVRPVPFQRLTDGVFNNPQPVCGECNWSLGAVSAVYSVEAA